MDELATLKLDRPYDCEHIFHFFCDLTVVQSFYLNFVATMMLTRVKAPYTNTYNYNTKLSIKSE